jgi:hypothetical protein
MWSEAMPIVADTGIQAAAMEAVADTVAAGMGAVGMEATEGTGELAATGKTSRRRNPKTRPTITATVSVPMEITRTTNPHSISTKTPKTINLPIPLQTLPKKKSNPRSRQIPGSLLRK